jgi:hypothetical protein
MFVALVVILLLAWALGFADCRCSMWVEDSSPVRTGLHLGRASSEVHNHRDQRADPPIWSRPFGASGPTG